MKKVLSLVLVIAMVLSSMSFAFGASAITDIADTDYAKAIEALTALGIVAGYEDGTYKPEKTITRAEMAKLMVITLGYGDLVAGSKSNFSDTQGHWANAYIALAAGKGIVVGDGNGKFRPDATVSYDEVYTMLVRGLGYTDSCNELKGMTWPTNFKVKAAELEITKDVKMSTNGADRGGVAQAIYNALEKTLVSVNTDGNVVEILDKSKKGVDLISRVAEHKEHYLITEKLLDPDNKDYASKIIDLKPYRFQDLDVYVNHDDQVVYIKDTNSLIFEGKYDDLVQEGTGLVLSVIDENDKTQKYTFKNTTGAAVISSDELFVNGEMKEVSGKYSDFEDAEYITIVANENEKTSNGKIDKDEISGYVINQQTRAARVDKEYVAKKAKIDVFTLPADDDDNVDLNKITVEGAVTSLEDIKADDVVVEYAAFDSDNDVIRTRLVVTRKSVEGKVTRVDGNKFYVDGTKYKLNSVKGSITKTELSLGDEGIFYLDHNGKIVDYDGEAAGPTDYAVIVGLKNGEADSGFGDYSIDTYPQFKLATQKNETIAYNIEVKMDSDGTVSDSADIKNGSVKTDIIAENNVKATSEADATNKLKISANIEKGDLVKYSINKAGRISDLELIQKKAAVNTTKIDLDKSANKFIAKPIIFNATDDDYDVVNTSVLPTIVEAYSVRNKNGDIEVLVVKAGEIEKAADTIYAYIYKVNEAYDKNNDKVQYVGTYTDNADKGLYTKGKNKITYNGEGVYAIKYDGDAVELAKSGDIKAGMGQLGDVVTATAVNAKGNMVKIDSKWYSMSDHGTVVNIKNGEEDGLADLYDIDVDVKNLKVYLNSDKEIDLILIIKK